MDIIAIMAIDTHALDQDQLERFDERAGIFEFDSGMSREDAERRAIEEMWDEDS